VQHETLTGKWDMAALRASETFHIACDHALTDVAISLRPFRSPTTHSRLRNQSFFRQSIGTAKQNGPHSHLEKDAGRCFRLGWRETARGIRGLNRGVSALNAGAGRRGGLRALLTFRRAPLTDAFSHQFEN